MIPAPFEYVRAGSAAEAISLVGQHGDDAKFLAGGHSLLPLMKLRLAQPAVLVDIARISDLSYIRDAGDHIAIGALTRHADVENSDLLAQHVPLLAHAASHVGDPQVRHRGTIGGSIAHADSASDLPATTLALGATYVAQGPNGTREIAAADFYKGFLESALAPDGMLTFPCGPTATMRLSRTTMSPFGMTSLPFIVRMRAPRSATVPCGLSLGTVIATS